MDEKEIRRLFKKYDFSIAVSGHGGFFNIGLDYMFRIFKKYGDNVERFKIEQIYDMSMDEWEELQRLYKEECIDVGGEFSDDDGEIVRIVDPHQRCSGIKANGDRCKNVNREQLYYLDHKKQLKLLRKPWFCASHKNQRDSLLRKAMEASHGL